jgi:hypothetical protein
MQPLMASSVKYHKTYLKLHKEYEAYAYPIIKKALDDQTGAVADFVNQDNFDNIDLYIQFLVQQKPLYNGLEKIYTRVGVSAATFSYDWIRNSVPKTKKDFIIDFFNAAWYEEMVNYFRLIGGTKVTGIDDTTRNIVKNLLANILGQNLSRRDQAKLFEESLNDPAFNRARSLVIARTESTTAANFGINMGAESSDYEVQKFWINTKDKRTRRSHLLMTKDRIALNQPFIVNGIEMMYPGEVGAPAAEVVNCRCVMATEALKDEDGLPILKPRTPPYIRAGSATRLPILPKPIIEVQQPTNIDQAKLKALEIINRNTNIRISNIEVDKNLTLKDFNEKINQLDKLTQDYNIVTGFTNKENVKLIFKSNKYLYGFIETDKGGKDLTRINFGSHAGNNRINFNAEGINRREFSKIDDDKLNISTTTHEFGHLISISEQGFLNSKHNQFWNEIININKRYVTEVKQYGTSASYDKNKLNSIYLGRYAESNLNEFMAEAFTEYKLSSNASQYALEVGRLIDKYFKK